MAAEYLRLGASADLGEGQSRGFNPRDDGSSDVMFVVRVQGRLYGWLNSCPHIAGAPMAWRKDAYLTSDGRLVCCYAHGALFEPDSGLCIQGPCVGKRLQAVPGLYEEAGEIRLLVKSVKSNDQRVG